MIFSIDFFPIKSHNSSMETAANSPIYTVSEINRQVRSFLEESVAPLWLSGEISNFAAPSSGHWYFTLKDANASLRCAFFKPLARGANFTPKNGMQVYLHGNISLYEARGEYQFVADSIELAGGGSLQQAFQVLKEKLLQEGLFDASLKKPLPQYPEKIGVITSPTGAAIHDILHVLKKRFPLIPVILYPSAVQGAQAANEIVEAIQTANLRNECDVLIVGRGGGSLEDLQAFNEENVARAIFASEIPIISAVGHEIDFTIADFVADLRAPTPSAAAALTSPDRVFLWQQVLSLFERLKRRHPRHQLQENQQKIDQLEQRLGQAFMRILNEKKQLLIHQARALNMLNPLSTLERGYAVVYRADQQKTLVRNTQDLKQEEKIIVRLNDGVLNCTVDAVLIGMETYA